MQEIYAALLLHSAKQAISEENIIKVLQSAGITPDAAKIKALVASLEGQNIEELLKQASVVQAAPTTTTEEKKEEKKHEEESKAAEAATMGLSALFG